ncbi:hypothetical protein EJB05_26897, partial [Eragrostis curvula]
MKPPPPTTTTAGISSKDPRHHHPTHRPAPPVPPPTSSSHHHLRTAGNPSSAAIGEPTLARVDCDSTCATSYLVIVGGFLFLGWAKGKDERDAAAKQKTDDEQFDAMMRDACDEMVCCKLGLLRRLRLPPVSSGRRVCSAAGLPCSLLRHVLRSRRGSPAAVRVSFACDRRICSRGFLRLETLIRCRPSPATSTTPSAPLLLDPLRFLRSDPLTSILDINMTNLVRHMLCDLKKQAVKKVYQKESVEEEEDEDGNLWPKAKELMDAKPEDFATQEAWNALCLYWSTPSFRKKSKIRDGVDPGQIGAWHHQHRMQQGTNRALCSKKAATIWTRYDTAMTEKSGENWQEEHPDIDHVVVHNIAGAPHGTFAMGDGVIGPSDALSIKSRKRMHEESYDSGAASGASGNRAMLHQVESNPAWRAGIERVLQALAEKTNLDIDALMHPESEPNVDWCDGVERVLQAMAEIIPVDLSALLRPCCPEHGPSMLTEKYAFALFYWQQSTSTSVFGASRATVGTRASRSDGPIDDGQISA